MSKEVLEREINLCLERIAWNNKEATLTPNIDTCLWHKENVRQLEKGLKLLQSELEKLS